MEQICALKPAVGHTNTPYKLGDLRPLTPNEIELVAGGEISVDEYPLPRR